LAVLNRGVPGGNRLPEKGESPKGLIPPSGREAMRFMGIGNARDFAAATAALVPAGEFNLALEISGNRFCVQPGG